MPESRDRTPIALAGVLSGFLAVGLLVARVQGPSPAVPSLPDLSGAQIVEIRDASGRPVLTGELRQRTDPMGNVEKDAALFDRRGRRVIGEVEIELPGPSTMGVAQELEVDIIEIDANAKFSLFLDDREVTSFVTDDRGSVDIEIHGSPK
jgi:hypothetical protein